jgi:hypothetical protein
LVGALGVGVWIALVNEVEVPGWFLGLAYGVIAAVGIAGGILLRRFVKRS